MKGQEILQLAAVSNPWDWPVARLVLDSKSRHGKSWRLGLKGTPHPPPKKKRPNSRGGLEMCLSGVSSRGRGENSRKYPYLRAGRSKGQEEFFTDVPLFC